MFIKGETPHQKPFLKQTVKLSFQEVEVRVCGDQLIFDVAPVFCFFFCVEFFFSSSWNFLCTRSGQICKIMMQPNRLNNQSLHITSFGIIQSNSKPLGEVEEASSRRANTGIYINSLHSLQSNRACCL